MNILYIYGYLGNANGNVVQLIRSTFPEDNVICETYPQENFTQAVTFLNDIVIKEKIDIVIASSLGAFIALHLPAAPQIIVCNPCMEPCDRIPKLKPRKGQDFSGQEEMLKTYKEANDAIWSHEKPDNVIGCFSYHDSVLKTDYKPLFKEHFGEYEMIDCDHRLDSRAMPVLRKIVDASIKFGDKKSVLRQTEAEEKSSSVPDLVDLGLSVNWASCNLGATKPEEYGRYFSWGDVMGQTWDGSKWSDDGFEDFPNSKINAINNLKQEYDAAHVILGGSYRMPTRDECDELIDNCECVRVDDYQGTGVAGHVFTSKKNGNAIFLPDAGYGDGSKSPDFAGTAGYYWSGTFSDDTYAWVLGLDWDYACTLSFDGRNGLSVRPVSESK